MMFMTQKIERTFAKTGSQDGNSNPVVIAKYFNPCGAATWYLTEYDPESRVFFGYVTGLGHDEWGYVSRDELESIRLRWGLKIERDLHWTPKPFSVAVGK